MESKDKRPKVGVAVYIFNTEGKILIGKRKNAHGDGMYAPPGGHLEFGESFEECAAREVLEEVGITLKNIKFAGVTNDIFTKEDKHYITISMTAEWGDGAVQIMEPEKCDGWEWHDWENFPKNLFLAVENLRKQTKDLKPL